MAAQLPKMSDALALAARFHQARMSGCDYEAVLGELEEMDWCEIVAMLAAMTIRFNTLVTAIAVCEGKSYETVLADLLDANLNYEEKN